MRHKAAGPFVRRSRRLRRDTARLLEHAADIGTAKALLALGLAVCLGTGGYATVAAMSGQSPAPPPEAGAPPAPREAPRAGPSITVSDPAATPLEPLPSAPDPSRAERSQSPTAGVVTESPSAEPDTETEAPTTPPAGSPPGVGFRQEPDLVPPSTSLSHELPAPDAARFTFSADEEASYGCSLDGAAFSPCVSPVVHSGLAPGWHTFAVTAVDAAGNADPSPARVRWRVTAVPPTDQ